MKIGAFKSWVLCFAVVPLILLAIYTTGQFGGETKAGTPRFPSRPDFQRTPEAPPMPKALMKLPRTNITRAKYPAIDFHVHGRELRTAADYQKMIKVDG